MSDWVKCSDDLPDNTNYVTAYVDGRFYTASYYKNTWRQSYYVGAFLNGVTHWQPLPKPPEQEKEQ